MVRENVASIRGCSLRIAYVSLLSAGEEEKSGEIQALFILMSVSLSALSVDGWVRLSVMIPPATLSTLSEKTLAAGQVSTSRAYSASSGHVSSFDTQ
ncbi:hypothetical protein GDO78_011847 [Eleutherodactylus coqui]|uniref:Uncharacterized protein n=1 Tax=Eleutherodactylus coqui TaxID=57060 RepID=A0A8J6K646_ELECQ|nr:hypothetical protein GDO78_011847 [Eleutherodactylus coqui]